MKSFKNSVCIGFESLLTITFFTMLLFAPVLIVAQELYHLEVNSKSKDGKDLVMVLDEIERQDKFSIIKVKRISGASVPSAMFVVKGCYEIAKIRNVKYFTNLKEWTDEQGNRMYKIGYTSAPDVNPKEYFGEDIDEDKLIGHIFMSVDDFKVLMEKK